MSKLSYSMRYAEMFVEATKLISDLYKTDASKQSELHEKVYQDYKELQKRFTETLKMQEQEHARDNWYKDLLKNPPFGTRYIY